MSVQLNILYDKDTFLRAILGKCPFCYGHKSKNNLVGGNEDDRHSDKSREERFTYNYFQEQGT